MSLLKKIQENKSILLFGIAVIFVAIAFETAQQLYYIKRFNLAQDATFLGLFKFQAIRWFIWVLMAYPLWLLARKTSEKDSLDLIDCYHYIFLVVGLVIIDIVLISIAQIIITEESFSLTDFIFEYIPFFTFQKAPIYTLGYTATAIIFHFYYLNRRLQVDIMELGELQQANKEQYQELRKTHEDRATVLKIKVGNKQKLIPIDTINWIEADDYCSKVHTLNEAAYAMRISLKALEEKLSNNFLRVHRSAIVNMNQVQAFQTNAQSKLILKNGDEITVSKSKIKLVKDYLETL